MNIIQQIEKSKAKRILVFENGVEDAHGFSLLVSPTKERTWNNVLNHVTQVVKPTYGTVRHLKSINGTESIRSISDLVHGARYVACGKENFKELPHGYLTESERKIQKRKKCSQHYNKIDIKQENYSVKYWALLLAQKNKRTVIYAFVNGQKHHAIKFVLMEHELYNWQELLNHMSNMMDIPEGVQSLYTVYGHHICVPCEIQHGAYYVAVACGERFQQLDYIEHQRKYLLKQRRISNLSEPFTVNAVGSPAHLQLKNNCLLNKHLATKQQMPMDKVVMKAVVKQRTCGMCPKQPKPSKKTLEEKIPFITEQETLVKEAFCTEPCEVKVEEEGIKIVSNINIPTSNQITQTETSDKSLLQIETTENLICNETSPVPIITEQETIYTEPCKFKVEEGIKIVSNINIPTSNKITQTETSDKSLLQKETTENLIFTETSPDTAPYEENILELNSNRRTNSRKLLTIDENTEIIGNSEEYWDDDTPKIRKSLLQRRSTRFNFLQFSNISSDSSISEQGLSNHLDVSRDASAVSVTSTEIRPPIETEPQTSDQDNQSENQSEHELSNTSRQSIKSSSAADKVDAATNTSSRSEKSSSTADKVDSTSTDSRQSNKSSSTADQGNQSENQSEHELSMIRHSINVAKPEDEVDSTSDTPIEPKRSSSSSITISDCSSLSYFIDPINNRQSIEHEWLPLFYADSDSVTLEEEKKKKAIMTEIEEIKKTDPFLKCDIVNLLLNGDDCECAIGETNSCDIPIEQEIPSCFCERKSIDSNNTDCPAPASENTRKGKNILKKQEHRRSKLSSFLNCFKIAKRSY